VVELAAAGVPALWTKDKKGLPGIAACPGMGDLLEAFGKRLVPRIKGRNAEWAEAGRGQHRKKGVPPDADAWLRQPVGYPPFSVLHALSRIDDAALIKIRNEVMDQSLAELGRPIAGSELWGGWSTPGTVAGWIAGSAALERADRVRKAFADIVPQVRAAAHETLAREGRLGFNEMLAVATALCEEPPAELAERYDALLVDELQDTNPAQLAFYRAFASMARAKLEPIRTFFVGDGRQSIFRFRQADPFGWKSLVDEAKAADAHTDLTVNYRSSKALVKAQKTIFDALAEAGEGGVDPLGDLEPGTKAPPSTLDGTTHPEPILVVQDPEKAEPKAMVLAEFAKRLDERWKNNPDETAAVLILSWNTGSWAVKALRDRGIDAQLTGDPAMLGSRCCTDLRLFLSGLLDSSDDLAMAGVLKHPSIGVSDRGLLLLRRQGGFGRLFAPKPPLEVLEETDRKRLEAVLPFLAAARARLGREPTADVLERLAADLSWRSIAHAGPEGDRGVAIAQLEILLDYVRQLEADRVDPQAIVEALTPADRPGWELPVVRMHGRQKVVTVTTVHRAKGLEFDHVALVGVAGEGGSTGEGKKKNAAVRLAMPRGVPFLGVRLDPSGGLDRAPDPIGMMAGRLCNLEAREESLRLFYVGFTRAATSVTFGLGKGTDDGHSAIDHLRAVFLANPPPLAPGTVCVLKAAEVQPPLRKARKRVLRSRPFEAKWAGREGPFVAQASTERDVGMDRKAVVDAFRKNAKVVVGTGAPARPGIPGLDGVPAATWGEVVHGWFARWKFAGVPKVADAAEHLAEEWACKEKALAPWLVATGLAVRDRLPGFSDLLGNKLHFETPVTGLDGEVLWIGRTDLVVELPGRKAIVIDFKAGDQAATEKELPHVSRYAPQLEAYRRVLEGAGFEVIEVGLVYVAGPSWVRVENH
jgi:superfamily I DNA/RNA helicase